MPEGDTIFRTARTLQRALAGQKVTGFETVLPKLARVDYDTPLAGRTVESVEARGKWLLMHFSGDLILLTHMLMSGSWHIYRHGEKWQRHRTHMRIVVETPAILAVAFNVPVAEFHTAASLARREGFNRLGPAVLAPDFDAALAIANLAARPDLELGLALLDQTALAGLGNVFKSEVAFACGINPFRKVATLTAGAARRSRRHRAQIPPGQRDRSLRPPPHHRPHGPRGVPVGLRPRGPTLPPLRHAHPRAKTHGRRTDQLLVPSLPEVRIPVYDRTMSVEAKQLDSGIAVVTIAGRLAMGGETERLDAAVKGLLEQDQKKFVLDITTLDYVDSSGLGMLVSCLTNVKKAGGELKIAGANPRLRRIFAMTGVDTMMPMFDTLAAATA